MDGTPGLVTGLAGVAGGVIIAWINKGAQADVKGVKETVEKLIGADGKCGPETILGKLTARIDAMEARIASAAQLAQLPGEFTSLRGWVDGQVKALAERVRRAERTATGSQPALVDDEARRDVADLQRRLGDLEAERKDERDGALQLQLQMREIGVKLDLLLGGTIQLGGRRS